MAKAKFLNSFFPSTRLRFSNLLSFFFEIKISSLIFLSSFTFESKSFIQSYCLIILYWRNEEYANLNKHLEIVLNTEDALEEVIKNYKRSSFYIAQVLFSIGEFSKSWEIANKRPMPEDNEWNILIDGLKQTEWYKSNNSLDN